MRAATADCCTNPSWLHEIYKYNILCTLNHSIFVEHSISSCITDRQVAGIELQTFGTKFRIRDPFSSQKQ